MSSKEKLFQNIKNNPKNVSYNDLKRLLNLYGYELGSIRGSHHKFERDGHSIIVPYHKPIKEKYVRDIVEKISQIRGEK